MRSSHPSHTKAPDKRQPAAPPATTPTPLATQKSDFTAEGSPPPGMVATSEPVGSQGPRKAPQQDAVAPPIADTRGGVPDVC